jgi:hypothetical protein
MRQILATVSAAIRHTLQKNQPPAACLVFMKLDFCAALFSRLGGTASESSAGNKDRFFINRNYHHFYLLV